MKVHSKFLEHWHSFYSSHAHEFDASSSTLLELGGGPTVHSLISACQHVSNITFSDYAETNRREIRMWKEDDAKCEKLTLCRLNVVQCLLSVLQWPHNIIDIDVVGLLSLAWLYAPPKHSLTLKVELLS